MYVCKHMCSNRSLYGWIYISNIIFIKENIIEIKNKIEKEAIKEKVRKEKEKKDLRCRSVTQTEINWRDL